MSSVQFSSVAQLCPTLYDYMDCSTPGFTNCWSLTQLMSIESVMPSNHLILCHLLLLLPPVPPSSRVFSNESLFTWGGQRHGVSASASVLPMNTQDWCPLGWTGWISLQSKGLLGVFSNTTVHKASIFRHSAFFTVQLSYPYMTTGKTSLYTESKNWYKWTHLQNWKRFTDFKNQLSDTDRETEFSSKLG